MVVQRTSDPCSGEEANKLDKVKIIAFDEEDETLNRIKDGAIYATVVQQPFEFGYQSMALMSKVLNGDRSGIPASKQIFVPTVPLRKLTSKSLSRRSTLSAGAPKLICGDEHPNPRNGGSQQTVPRGCCARSR